MTTGRSTSCKFRNLRIFNMQYWIKRSHSSREGNKNAICQSPEGQQFTFSITLFPPKRVTNSAGEATVKSRCTSTFFLSRPCFTRCKPDMLGLKEFEGVRKKATLQCRWTQIEQSMTGISTCPLDHIPHDRQNIPHFQSAALTSMISFCN